VHRTMRSAIVLATLLIVSAAVVAPAQGQAFSPRGRVDGNRTSLILAQSGVAPLRGVEVASSGDDDESDESWDPKAPEPYGKEPEDTYERIGSSGPVYDRPARGKPFNSAFDRFYRLAKWAHKDATAIDTLNWTSYENLGLATRELYGFAVFNDPHKGHCSACHTLDEGNAGYPLFTDFAVPSLRNIGRRPYSSLIKSYTHDGYFKSLTGVVYYYDTREVAPWLIPSVRATANTTELGNLGLTATDEGDLVAFMKTLTDE
jgi:cytochrome c peroxidase